MPKCEFRIGGISGIDNGRIAAALDECIKHATEDCVRRRPHVAKKRTVSLKIDLTPIDPDGGEAEAVGVKFICNLKLPDQQSRDYVMTPGLRQGADGKTEAVLEFNSNEPDARQSHLADLEDETEWSSDDS